MTENHTPEPVDPFSPEELDAIVNEAVTDRALQGIRDEYNAEDGFDGEDDVYHLIGEVEWQESTELPPLRIRMIIQWPHKPPPEMPADIANLTRRIHLARLSSALGESMNEQLQQEIPIDQDGE